ncbi:hypothetical protein BGZ95_011158, partial [Linnemannia exigua]
LRSRLSKCGYFSSTVSPGIGTSRSDLTSCGSTYGMVGGAAGLVIVDSAGSGAFSHTDADASSSRVAGMTQKLL